MSHYVVVSECGLVESRDIRCIFGPDGLEGECHFRRVWRVCNSKDEMVVRVLYIENIAVSHLELVPRRDLYPV